MSSNSLEKLLTDIKWCLPTRSKGYCNLEVSNSGLGLWWLLLIDGFPKCTRKVTGSTRYLAWYSRWQFDFYRFHSTVVVLSDYRLPPESSDSDMFDQRTGVETCIESSPSNSPCDERCRMHTSHPTRLPLANYFHQSSYRSSLFGSTKTNDVQGSVEKLHPFKALEEEARHALYMLILYRKDDTALVVQYSKRCCSRSERKVWR